jgi:hypothetical protein
VIFCGLRGFADAGLAAHDQHARVALDGVGEQPVDRPLLSLTAVQHAPSFSSGPPPSAMLWPAWQTRDDEDVEAHPFWALSTVADAVF